jgi:membrane-bound lytic murein transglycosylase A
VQLEGFDGLGKQGTLLHGSELAWLRTRFEAFMIHVQGSAVLEFSDGSKRAIGFAGATDYAFKGIPIEYLRKQKVAWAKLPQFFQKRPDELDRLLSENNRFIFFKEQESTSPIGSLGLPVVEERSIAIDQGRLPPGAVSIIRTSLPRMDKNGKIQVVRSSRFVLNLDSGSAIRGPGRVDVFMGTGDQARERANHVHGGGELYYLFSKRSG